jgi:signal transduction histidine kinase
MNLDTQTTIFMISFVYLILHSAIWLALQEYRSYQVKLWCASGIFSGVAVALLAMRGNISEYLFIYVAQLLMLIGNWGRMVALRIYLPHQPKQSIYLIYNIANSSYFIIFCYLMYFKQAEWEALILFNGFYALLCFDYFRIGLKLNLLEKSLGAKLLIWAGLILTSTLAVRTLGVAVSGTIDNIYAPSWHQALMVIGQFVAITLSNIAFLRIFLEIAERQKLAVASELAVTNERADYMQKNSMSLKKLLLEREEIIRQLSLFNKTAGMGALVASLAHELNQPLTVIQMNTEMIDLILSSNESQLTQHQSIDKAMIGLKKANQRAATIISSLRNMFGNGSKSVSSFNINDLVNDVLLLSTPTLNNKQIKLNLHLSAEVLNFTGDNSQLQQVLLNLITNASQSFDKAVQKEKHITIATKLENERIILTVSDNGSGIASEIELFVFELLRTNKIDGMGIGLWLSKSIVESHNGTIEFETSASNGTCFTVSLPATTQALIY